MCVCMCVCVGGEVRVRVCVCVCVCEGEVEVSGWRGGGSITMVGKLRGEERRRKGRRRMCGADGQVARKFL